MKLLQQQLNKEANKQKGGFLARLFFIKGDNTAFKDSDINICSKALNAIGAESITSFSEGRTEAKVAYNKYQICKQKLLSIYPWTFNRVEAYVAKIAENENSTFKYIYEKPKDFLAARTLREGTTTVDFIFVNGKINTNAQKPILVYSADCNEEDMPPYFVSLLIDLCARDFLIPVTGKEDNYSQFDKIFQNSFMEAKHVDAKNKSPSVIDTSLLIGVR